MSTNPYNQNIICSFSYIANLLKEKTELRFKVLQKDLEIQGLKAELESEQFLQKYLTGLKKTITEMETFQCWN